MGVGGRQLPGNPASAVYGTIVTAGQLAIESASGSGTGVALGALGGTLLIFWLAHAYTDTLGGVIGGAAQTPSLRHALRVEWPIVESGIAPAAALVLARLLGAGNEAAALTGLVVASLELVGWAVLAGRRAGAGGGRLVAYSAVAALLGAVLVGLKFVLH